MPFANRIRARLQKQTIKPSPFIKPQILKPQSSLLFKKPIHQEYSHYTPQEKQLTIFERLKLIALQKLPETEQTRILKELEQLKQGTLAEEKRQKLFEKLKITSTWYETHKEILHNEILTWLNKNKKE